MRLLLSFSAFEKLTEEITALLSGYRRMDSRVCSTFGRKEV